MQGYNMNVNDVMGACGPVGCAPGTGALGGWPMAAAASPNGWPVPAAAPAYGGGQGLYGLGPYYAYDIAGYYGPYAYDIAGQGDAGAPQTPAGTPTGMPTGTLSERFSAWRQRTSLFGITNQNLALGATALALLGAGYYYWGWFNKGRRTGRR